MSWKLSWLSLFLTLSSSLFAAEAEIRAKFNLTISEHRYYGGGGIAEDFTRDFTTSFDAVLLSQPKVIPMQRTDESQKIVRYSRVEYRGYKILDVSEQPGSLPVDKSVSLKFSKAELDALRGKGARVNFTYRNDLGATPDQPFIQLARVTIDVDSLLTALADKGKVTLPISGTVDQSAGSIWPGVEARAEGTVTLELVK